MNYCLITVYAVISLNFFAVLLNFSHKECNLSKKQKLLSTIVALVAALLWPITIPISYLELLQAKLETT
ncbi:hypothetical protein [Lyngbya aestuarii]|uniref:hypothetical protein n=1 Tax=Lyngbya aestuarii TaxID=118322 RepID=UPI00403E261F